MQISRDEARRIATLAHLELHDAELERMAAEMTQILGYIDRLRELDVAAADDAATAATPLRDDEPRPSIDRALVERNAPRFADGCFVVPQIIAAEGSAGEKTPR